MQKQSLNKGTKKLQRKIEAKSFALLLALALFFPSCSGNKPSGNAGGANVTPTATPAPTSPPQTKFSIDGDRAFEHVRKQVEWALSVVDRDREQRLKRMI